MSVERTLGTIVVGLTLCSSAAVCVAEEDGPDIEFLEYLGMWEESDQDWLILDETMAADSEERSDPEPQGEESMEKEDES